VSISGEMPIVPWQSAGASGADVRRATVLVVDDVEAHRYVVGTWLRREGYAVVEAATGTEALEAVANQTIDIVTLDVHLPDMSGMEVCERIKSTPRTAALPILHLSGTAVDPADRNEGLRRGADAYLVEPVESDELVATINALLRYSAARRRAVRIAGHLRRLHTATLGVSGASSLEDLVSAVAEGTSTVFARPAAVVLTVGNRSLAGAARPGEPAQQSRCPAIVPHEAGAAVSADGVIPSSALSDAPVVFADVEAYTGAPLSDRSGTVLGAVLVAADHPDTAEEASENQLILDQLAHAVSISIGNLRAFELEHRISLTLQRSLLPDRLVAPQGLDLAFRYEAAADDTEVGGDFYEVFELDGGEVMVAVGDVVGHSLQAAIVMAELRNSLRAYALDGHAPTAILERLDRMLRRFHTTVTATVCLAVLDVTAGTALVANAGHISPLLIPGAARAAAGAGVAGAATFVEPHGPLLGMGLPAPTPVTVDLASGDTLLLVTDGLLERRREIIDVGLDRMVAVAADWDGDDLDHLCDRMLADVGPGPEAADDIAMLAVRLLPASMEPQGAPLLLDQSAHETSGGSEGREEGPATDRHRVQNFERSSREIARARGFVTGALEDWGFGAEAASFELMVSELVSNALVHGSGAISVEVSRDDGNVRLEVTDDGGSTSPHIEDKAMGGWGLQFVDELADRWGSEKRGERTLVWVVRRMTET
jgi:CheY-like chemotaxis protein/serine phosphatase RsbU (regulator of sigma subunit)/anti-sigma regulatory factor (Ser/Thr protein kinase)